MKNRTRHVFVIVACIGLVNLILIGGVNSASAQISVQGTENTKLCNKKPISLSQGTVYGYLKPKYTNTTIYQGPSVLCPKLGWLKKYDRFLISGKQKSGFGKSWYHVSDMNQVTKGWVPAKYLTIGISYKPDKKEVSDTKSGTQNSTSNSTEDSSSSAKEILSSQEIEIAELTLVPTIGLNIRSCPDTSCDAVSIADPNVQYIATKKSENDWYLISISEGTKGWVSGKYVNQVSDNIEEVRFENTELVLDRDVIPEFDQPANSVVRDFPKPNKAIKAESEFPGFCRDGGEINQFIEKGIWRVKNVIGVSPSSRTRCTAREKLPPDSVIALLGSTKSHYQIAYLDSSKIGYWIGYIPISKFSSEDFEYLYSIDEKPSYETASSLVESEQYWQSWEYKLSRAWDQLILWCKLNPKSFLGILGAILLLVAYIIPWSRKWIQLTISKVLGYVEKLFIFLVKVVEAMCKDIYRVLHAIFVYTRNLILSRRISIIAAHWDVMVQGLSIRPSEFYQFLENQLKEKQLPNSHVLDISWREGGPFSANRLYLRVRRDEYAFDICCAPFGNGSFFSYWMGSVSPLILSILYRLPIISWVAYFFERIFRPDTYWRNDTLNMFLSLVHTAVMDSVDHYTNEKGLKPITQDSRKPKMKEFFDLKPT